jgi:hypothetical protein
LHLFLNFHNFISLLSFEDVIMFEDTHRNLIPMHEAGARTVLIHHGRQPGVRHSHVHLEIANAAVFLREPNAPFFPTIYPSEQPPFVPQDLVL